MTEEDNEKLKEELTGVLEEEKQKMQSSEQMSVVEQIKNNKSQENKSNGTRADGNRSVMVVLPFRADDGEESLEELYTRSPIVVMEEQKEVEGITQKLLLFLLGMYTKILIRLVDLILDTEKNSF